MKEIDCKFSKKDNIKLMNELIVYSYIHSINTGGIIFTNYLGRKLAGQMPFEIKIIDFPTDMKGDTDFKGLRKIIESRKEPLVLIHRNKKTGSLISSYFLPKQIDENHYKRN